MSDTPAPADGSPDGSPDALSAALRQLLAPLARLALARGLTHAALDELLKQALVQAADQQLGALPAHRRVSRITTTTGIHRREVSRLVEQLRDGGHARAPAPRSHASELFHHWRTNPAYGDLRGSPAELARTGEAPSFESLAQAITRDVHPRGLLDELLRLGLAAHDTDRDTVRLVREAFVPQGDVQRMLRVLGNNVGSHFDSAVDNVLVNDRQHFEQALFADGISAESMAEFRLLVRDQWAQLLRTMVPAMEAMVERDAAAAAAATQANPEQPPQPRQHVRLGLYTHARPDRAAPAPAPAVVARLAKPKPKPQP